MQPLTSATPFRSGHPRAAAAVFLLAASLATHALSAVSSLIKLATGAAARVATEEEDINLFDLLDLGLGLLYLIVFVSTVVVFCMWLHRAYQNLPALGNPRPGLQYSPRWAVGSFFVPFANLIIPYRAVRETWAKSDPVTVDADYFAPLEPSSPSFLNVWWGFWLASNFVHNASFRVRMRGTTPDAMLAATWLDLAGDLLSIVAAALAIKAVRAIDRRQEERSRRVVYEAAGPPPPPLFTPQTQAGGQV